jgi:hypothetical protein
MSISWKPRGFFGVTVRTGKPATTFFFGIQPTRVNLKPFVWTGHPSRIREGWDSRIREGWGLPDQGVEESQS